LVNRSFSGANRFTDQDLYTGHSLLVLSFDPDSPEALAKQDASGIYHLAPNEEYAFHHKYAYGSLTSADHLWIRVSLNIRYPSGYRGAGPHLVAAVERPEGSYGYYAPEIPVDTTGAWTTYSMDYLTPEIRNPADEVSIFFWNRGKQPLDIDNFKIEVFQRKPTNLD